MKTKLVLAVVVAVGFLLLPSGVKTQTNAEKEVRDLEQKINASYAANDLPTYFTYYSKDFTQWLPEGRTDLPEYEKMWTDYVKNVARVESVELSDVHVQVGPSGDAAVASYLLHVKSRTAKGEITEEDNQESDVLFKRNGVWKVVFLHYSPVPKKKE
ncbi:MAG: YybH family protein [Candidatus Acidiferrales bacterium]